MRIQKAVELTKAITELPEERIDQMVGMYRESQPCCVGAHLANILDVDVGEVYDWVRGANEFARLMDVSQAHVILLLREAGAGQAPFDIGDWDNPPAQVWENLSKIEEFPSTRNADFSYCNLANANLSMHDFRDSCFRKTTLIEADLSDGDFRGCCFDEAEMHGAIVTKARFDKATFEMTDLQDVAMEDAY